MLQLIRGDIVLKRIDEGDIELIRQWRNSDDVKKFMEFREYIDEKMQREWFKKINNKSNLYFIIYSNNHPIGMIYGANLNWKEKHVENAGIFIASKEFRENRFALEASLLVNDFAYASGMEKIYIRVLKSNTVAKTYNKLLGYELLPNQEDVENQQYTLNKRSYTACRERLGSILKISPAFLVKTETEECIIDKMLTEELHQIIFG